MTAGDYGEYPDEKTHLLAEALEDAGIPHAFGGAIALFFVGEPRGTTDIDVNIFLPEQDARRAFDVLEKVGAHFDRDAAQGETDRRGQVRVLWERTYVDLFFAYADFHASVAARARRANFRGRDINVISGEDLLVFKMLFSRGRDWADIEQTLYVSWTRLDFGYIKRWLVALIGEDDGRVTRFDSIVTAVERSRLTGVYEEPPPGCD
ncbi:MAG: nucleotidyltransferase [Chloroflexi bacterium]|nr:nucleotidyltransferase [Chloroflexota bacterium]